MSRLRKIAYYTLYVIVLLLKGTIVLLTLLQILAERGLNSLKNEEVVGGRVDYQQK